VNYALSPNILIFLFLRSVPKTRFELVTSPSSGERSTN
jgi:hypothetical protein